MGSMSLLAGCWQSGGPDWLVDAAFAGAVVGFAAGLAFLSLLGVQGRPYAAPGRWAPLVAVVPVVIGTVGIFRAGGWVATAAELVGIVVSLLPLAWTARRAARLGRWPRARAAPALAFWWLPALTLGGLVALVASVAASIVLGRPC